MTREPGARTDRAANQEREVLEEKRDVLFASLRDLETERARGDIGGADYEALHDDYTTRAAELIRAIEECGQDLSAHALRAGKASRPDGRGGRKEPSGRSPRRPAVLTAVVVTAVIAVASVAVLASSGDRAKGQPLSGSLPSTRSATEDRLSAAIELDRQGKGLEAIKVYDEILRAEPDNPDALAYRGWLLKRAGLIDEALVSLDRAVKVAPTYPDAHFFRGMVLFQDRADPAGAVTEFETFLAADPPAEMVPTVQSVLERARSAVAAPVPSG